ncbi:MAG: hypothetical protein M1269_08880 [Chloroflexi bacterium]|nr:hypothetical protein [Chloroflexota bacterium]
MSEEKFEQFMEKINSRIESSKDFKSGKVDIYGHVVGIKEYPPGRVPHQHQTHYYDNNGNVIKLEIFEPEFTKPLTRIYFYNPGEDKLIESIWFNRYNRLMNIHRYRYDSENGLMLERYEYDKEGQLFYSIKSVYLRGELIGESWHNPRGALIKRYRYENYPDGELSLEETYNSADRMEGFFTFTYDGRGNLRDKVWHNAEGRVMSTFRYTCDENDNVVKIELTGPDGMLEAWQVFTHDGVGNILTERWYDGTGEVIKDIRY